MDRIKLLSPAGNEEAFNVALLNGADEIYLGMGDFNARAKAENFASETLKKCIERAHLFGVRVFCTMNTLIYDSEIDAFIKSAKQAINAGVDAFIVQDLAVVKILKTIYPNVELHTSTQMGVHNEFGGLIAKKIGAKRIVLSRETTLQDIKAIKKATGLDIEYFIHGALCVAFSGNCYLSRKFANNSGNRGKCLGLCRLPYTVSYGNDVLKKGYYLSARDLCMYKYIKELEEVGVNSLKIEGRLRRTGYVGVATSVYRKAIDLGNISENDLCDLKTAFNRGNYLYDGYLKGDIPDNVIYDKVPNHLGLLIGEVVSVSPFKTLYSIVIKTESKLKTNDGLKFIRDEKEIGSLGVGNVNIVGKNLIEVFGSVKVKAGDKVYQTLNSEREKILNERKKSFDLFVKINANEKAQIIATIDNKKIEISSLSSVQNAINSPITKEDIEKSFNKLNDTDLRIGKMEIETNNAFMSKSELNALRRELVEKILSLYIVKDKQFYNFDYKIIEAKKTILHFETNRMTNDTENVVIMPTDYREAGLSKFLEEKLNKYKGNIYLWLHPFFNDNDIKSIYETVKKFDRIIIVANNIGQLKFCEITKVIAGPYMNIINQIARNEIINLGAIGVCSAFELNESEKDEFMCEYEIKGYPNIVAWFSHCPFKTVKNATCKNCAFNNDLVYKSDNNVDLKMNRYLGSRCYFFTNI